MSAKKTLKAIGVHFVVTMALLSAETIVELFLHWNPSGIKKEIVDPIIDITNWFLIGTIAQFCVLAFILLLLASAEEFIDGWKEFREKTKRNSGVK